MKRGLILVLMLAAGTFVATYVRISDGIDQTSPAKIHNEMMESEAEQILANLDATRW
jgi:hypothetical protein